MSEKLEEEIKKSKAQWSPQITEAYDEVVKELKAGNLKWEKISEEEVKDIEVQVVRSERIA